MDVGIKIEFYIFLNSIYAGLITGIIYDWYRVIRYYFKPKGFATLIEDLLFWIGVGLIFFYIINKSNWGQLRAYIFIGYFLGGLLYLKLLSKVLFPFFIRIFNRLRLVIKGIVYILKFPFVRVRKILSPAAKRIRKAKKVSKEAVGETIRLRRIISKKK
ncbi:MAG: spore cortex biosynthesis protein YabQ [Tissierellia bacterium]|nr:spore cortex biosynthesis protein YabQ [Tissierellia bacterium]